MSQTCPECGAPIPSGGVCRDNFDALLALEWEVPGGAGTLAHFYAVSSYILQHPDSMQYTVGSLGWLRASVAKALFCAATTEDLRRSAREEGKPTGRVTRRAGDTVPQWSVERWTTTVADVLAGGVNGYGDRVRAWAESVLGDLARSEG